MRDDKEPTLLTWPQARRLVRREMCEADRHQIGVVHEITNANGKISTYGCRNCDVHVGLTYPELPS